MTPPFLCLMAATVLLRLLSSDARKTFDRRLAALLPRSVVRDHLRILRAEFPERLGRFRLLALPHWALHVIYNAASCACFAVALWFFPPAGINSWDLLALRYAGVLMVPLAFVADVVVLVRMLLSTFGRGDSGADEPA